MSPGGDARPSMPQVEALNPLTDAFSGRERVAAYAEATKRRVPGLDDMHRMAGLLLAEHVPADGRVLVLGAGGGMELVALLRDHTGWRFDGVDPSADMLAAARLAIGAAAHRVAFHEALIDGAPEGPFDGATCLLTLHFLAADERLRTLRELHRRLKPGAPLVVAHHSVPGGEAGKATWFGRSAAFAAASGIAAADAASAVAAMRARLPALSPDEDVALLREAGFVDVALFYAAFSFRGWVALNG